MRFYVGVTDYSWFRFLQAQAPVEVNFWRPGGTGPAFKAIEPGAPFLFKLHKPRHFIVGGGFFSGFSRLPLSFAWDAFGTNNGAAEFADFRAAIRKYQQSKPGVPVIPDPQIGCVILSNPFFFEEKDWIPAPLEWSNSIVQGKTFGTNEATGKSLWERAAALLPHADKMQLLGGVVTADSLVRDSPANSYPPNVPINDPYANSPVLGTKYLRTARLGQGAFRALTLENFARRCCITGENTVPVLQAAHIQPVARSGTHSLRNGLLLRADLHILYDRGLLSVSPDMKVRVSSLIHDQYLNGKVYYAHDGSDLRSLPANPDLCPDPELLDWHYREVFVP